MAQFPKLRTGAVAQYPSTREVGAAVHVTRFVDGSEQRFRNIGGLVRRWVVRLHAVDEGELADIRRFFDEQRGRFGSFAFVDPWDGVEYADCSFDMESMTATYRGELRGTTTLVIRCNEAQS
jgi:hypothetical protein